ncbi:MAG: hypothetical protein KGH55_01075 [Nanoarchaeota archaeon]|nr:hypothetical protein [Nanoarchaeota archaeon]
MGEGYRRDFVNHLKRTLSKGYKEQSLRTALLNQGYSDVVIDRALDQALKELAEEEKAKKEKEKPKITYQIYDENNRLVKSSKPSFWKKLFGRR